VNWLIAVQEVVEGGGDGPLKDAQDIIKEKANEVKDALGAGEA
jgi:hypothetical protein